MDGSLRLPRAPGGTVEASITAQPPSTFSPAAPPLELATRSRAVVRIFCGEIHTYAATRSTPRLKRE